MVSLLGFLPGLLLESIQPLGHLVHLPEQSTVFLLKLLLDLRKLLDLALLRLQLLLRLLLHLLELLQLLLKLVELPLNFLLFSEQIQVLLVLLLDIPRQLAYSFLELLVRFRFNNQHLAHLVHVLPEVRQLLRLLLVVVHFLLHPLELFLHFPELGLLVVDPVGQLLQLLLFFPGLLVLRFLQLVLALRQLLLLRL